MVKNTPANAGDTGDVGSVPGLKRKYECILKEDRAAYLEYLVGEEEW